MISNFKFTQLNKIFQILISPKAKLFNRVKISNFQKGFTMVELIVTLALLSFGVIGVYAAFYPITTLNYNISARFTAAYLAQEGMEIVRNIRDTNFIVAQQNSAVQWNDGLLSCQLGCQGTYRTGTAAATSEDTFGPYVSTSYLMLDSDGFYGYSATGQKTPFTRKITIMPISPDILQVITTVYWEYNSVSYNFQTEENLYNWY